MSLKGSQPRAGFPFFRTAVLTAIRKFITVFETNNIASANILVERLGVIASPQGRFQSEGVLNPAIFQDRSGNLVMIMRSVATGNQSRLETMRQIWKDGKPACDADGNELPFERVGFACVPQAAYERRRKATTSGSFELVGGEGCEDPRVTFIPVLDKFVLCYTAFGFDGRPSMLPPPNASAYASPTFL